MSVYASNLVALNLVVSNKQEAIRELAQLVVNAGRGTDVAQIVTDVLTRDEMGTPQVDGVAIPHARSAGVTVPTVAIARTTGVTFDPDENPATVIFMILVPEGEGDEHITILSGLARRLMDPNFTQALRTSQDPEAIVELLAKEEA